MLFKRQLIIGAFLILLPIIGWAQEPARKVDETTLRALYERSLTASDNEYLQKRIIEERTGIRSIVEEDLREFTETLPDEEKLGEAELVKALDRQQATIDSLRERLQERRVDLDILLAEERQYYRDPQAQTGASLEPYRLTRSHADLLAKKAILEERIALLESLIPLQEERLGKLQFEQRLQQFSFLISAGKYLLIIILIWFAERTLRTRLLVHIQDSHRRYTLTKVISITTYSLIIIWIIAVTLAKYPNALASLAIVGAGLAIATQNVVKDLLGAIVIFQYRLFSKGDRITVGNVTGEVIDVGILRTLLLEVGLPKEPHVEVLERSGRVLSLPNELFLTSTVYNHNTTSDYMKAEMTFAITFDSNWRRAKKILEDILQEEAGDFAEAERKQHIKRTWMFYIPHRTGGNQVHLNIASDGIECTLRFTVPIGDRRPAISRITDKVLERFNAESDVSLAYKTTRVIANPAVPPIPGN